VHVATVYTDLSWWHTGRKFDVPVYTTQEIYEKAMRLLNMSGYKRKVRNLAVSVYDLVPSTDEQLECDRVIVFPSRNFRLDVASAAPAIGHPRMKLPFYQNRR